MKAALSTCWALILLGSLSGCPAQEPQGPAPLRVAMDPRIGLPFIQQANKDQYGGFEVEVCQYLADKLKRPLQIIPARWNDLPELVRKGKAELALNAIEKPAHPIAGLNSTEHYYTAYQQLAVRKQDKFTYGLGDLKNKRVGVVEGSVAQLFLEELNRLKKAGVQIRAYATPELAFEGLAKGNLNAALTERAFAGWFSWKGAKIRLTGEPISGETPYVGLLRADQTELKHRLDQALKQAFKDPAFRRIFDKWHVSIKR